MKKTSKKATKPKKKLINWGGVKKTLTEKFLSKDGKIAVYGFVCNTITYCDNATQ